MNRLLTLAAVTVLATAASSVNAATIYTTSATFLSQVAAGSYLNNLSTVGNDGVNPTVGPISFSGNGFAYTILSSPSANLFADTSVIGTWNSLDTVTIAFTSSNVTAVGFNLFFTDVFNNLLTNGNATILLSDGTIDSFTPLSRTNYRGYVSTGAAITSISFTPVTGFFYNIDNITVGAAIPEPTTLAVLAGAGALVLRRRRA